jgi:hypothetical protein
MPWLDKHRRNKMTKRKRIYNAETSGEPALQLKPIQGKRGKPAAGKRSEPSEPERSFTPDLILGIIERIKKL